MKIGIMTIGQSPRLDMSDIWLGVPCEILEIGALDGLSDSYIKQTLGGDYSDTLITKLRSGESVAVRELFIYPLLQNCVLQLEDRGVDAIMLLCTGQICTLNSSVPLYCINDLMQEHISNLYSGKKLAIIVPDGNQISLLSRRWHSWGVTPVMFSCSPYGSPSLHTMTAEKVRTSGCDAMVLDCMGFDIGFKNLYTRIAQTEVILPREVISRKLRALASGEQ